jgi:hypothetical protein
MKDIEISKEWLSIIRKREITLIILMFIVFSLMGYKAYTVTMGIENITRTNLMLIVRTPQSIIKLQEHTQKINLMAGDIESVPLGEIKSAFTETVSLINLTTREIDAQYAAWLALKLEMNNDGASFKELKANLDTIRTLQNEEIVSLKKTLDEVEEVDMIESLISILISFFIGVLSSVVASIAFPKFAAKVKSLRNIIQ